MSVTIADPVEATASTLQRDPYYLQKQQHILLDQMSWNSYEKLLEEVSDQVRLTFYKGSLEIMAPLSLHEVSRESIGALIELMCMERNIELARFGSTTFRNEKLQAGLEPDKCYYLANAARVRGMERFDPAFYPPPDLAVEIDITRRSIARDPIYAALGVRELWRFDGQNLTVFSLNESGSYAGCDTSPSFPFLPLDKFVVFVHRMKNESQLQVMKEFQGWVRTLA